MPTAGTRTAPSGDSCAIPALVTAMRVPSGDHANPYSVGFQAPQSSNSWTVSAWPDSTLRVTSVGASARSGRK